MTIYNTYDQLAEIIANLDPEKILALKAYEEMQARLEDLIEKSKEGNLDRREKDELDHYIVLERLMRLAKIRAQSPNQTA
ncbi:hypothetical protein [Emticicia sp. BO119]|uniref:hypothetical protein n=1 Tax=Emticicia sp. BO119 TaxID=2757768 RepID=UPI0015F05FB2|nr:hypothetical protein [Emticicia sp. BO119]MBA4852890.1 hypothetical protein [Emticicia sp. BO119]